MYDLAIFTVAIDMNYSFPTARNRLMRRVWENHN